MPIKLIHLSDLHLRIGWAEEQGLVLDSFFLDLRDQIKDPEKTYIVFSGDIAQSGGDPNILKYFTENLGEKFLEFGFKPENMIYVPGNHDVDRNYVKENVETLKGLQERGVDETKFNNIIYGEIKKHILPKFKNFLDWQQKINSLSFDENSYCGKGFALTQDIGIYCLNTALYSFGGLTENNVPIDDEGKLPIETRKLHDWLQNTKFTYKILVMHHPKEWLNDWAREEIDNIGRSYFDLILCGHIHKSDALHSNNGCNDLVECIAPPLFTKKKDNLGYSIIHIDEKTKSTSIQYRHRSKSNFLRGVVFSQTDDGCVNFNKITPLSGKLSTHSTPTLISSVLSYLENEFENSLKHYESTPPLWVMPNISDSTEDSTQDNQAVLISAKQFCGELKDCIIKAPPQFGLSTLGRFIALETWKDNQGKYTLFLNSNDLANFEKSIKKSIEEHLNIRGLSEDSLCAIILDETNAIDERKVNNLKQAYSQIPLIILYRVGDQKDIGSSLNYTLKNKFKEYYLWSFDRQQVREFVNKFIEYGFKFNEDDITQKLVDDLEALNLHRSPLNCLTLLAVYQHIEASPVNRTDMLEKFLSLVFMTHKKRQDYSDFPDMKDSFFVMGAFCENMIRSNNYSFLKKDFITFSENFCIGLAIYVDVSTLFDILHIENIIIERNSEFIFKFTHWLYFFSAQRMHNDNEFREYICSDKRYVDFPEIIEFYTGIDRKREELIDLLIRDLEKLNTDFEARTNINREFDPFEKAKWSPLESDIEYLKDYIDDELEQSTLPKSTKDEIADQSYDRGRPYNQIISTCLRDSSLHEGIQIMRASARALRNSNYINKDKKRKLLLEITRTWAKVLQLLAILSPVFVKNREIRFENLWFYLDSSFDDLKDEKLWYAILDVLPFNLVGLYEKDISSARMAPLYKHFLETSEHEVERHIVACILIRQKPTGWMPIVKEYMNELNKNSFYLLSTFKEARREYLYGFCSSKQKTEIKNLLGVAIAKHEYGSKSPSLKLIKKAGKKVADLLEKAKK